jgi:hypothetical protein
MRHAKYLGLLILTFALGVTFGCQNATKAPFTPRPDPVAGNYPRQVTVDGLHEVLVVGQPVVQRSTPDQPMRVTVPVRSVFDHGPLNVQYQFTFLDDRGRPLRGGDSGWRFQRLEPRAPAYFDANAMDPAAADWNLVIRSAR